MEHATKYHMLLWPRPATLRSSANVLFFWLLYPFAYDIKVVFEGLAGALVSEMELDRTGFPEPVVGGGELEVGYGWAVITVPERSAVTVKPGAVCPRITVIADDLGGGRAWRQKHARITVGANDCAGNWMTLASGIDHKTSIGPQNDLVGSRIGDTES